MGEYMMMKQYVDQKIALIIPAFNEEVAIGKTIEGFAKVLPDSFFVVVDNNSRDNTSKIASEKMKKLTCKGKILFEPRQGKALAVRKAFDEIDADYYIMVDADCTYSPDDVYALLEPVINDEIDLVVGDRQSGGTYKSQNKRRFHNVGNILITKIINRLFNSDLKDIMSGYRALNRKFVKNFPILSTGFELETEMTLHALDKRFRIKEVPIKYLERPKGSISKLNTIKDGIRILKTILVVFKDFKPFQFFFFLSVVFFLFGIFASMPVIFEFIATGIVLHIPLAILSTGLMTFSLIFFAIGFINGTIAKFQRFNYELQLKKFKE